MTSKITRKPLRSDSATYLKIASTSPEEIEPAKYSNVSSNASYLASVGEDHPISWVAALPLQYKETIPALSSINDIYCTQPARRIKYTKWGVHWRQPTYVLLCTLSAVVLAIGHHFYYTSLSGTPAGSSRRQQWANTFGISFSYLVVHLLGVAIAMSYSQYIWSIVRQRGYTLKALDDLFSMTFDLSGLLNLEILKHGRIAIPLGLVYWYVREISCLSIVESPL